MGDTPDDTAREMVAWLIEQGYVTEEFYDARMSYVAAHVDITVWPGYQPPTPAPTPIIDLRQR